MKKLGAPFDSLNPQGTPGNNEALVCLKLEQIISVGEGRLITNNQIFFLPFFFLNYIPTQISTFVAERLCGLTGVPQLSQPEPFLIL